MCDFSVAICVYHRDSTELFRLAVESVTKYQSKKPSEVIIVVDGPIHGDLDDYVSSLEKDRLFKSSTAARKSWTCRREASGAYGCVK